MAFTMLCSCVRHCSGVVDEVNASDPHSEAKCALKAATLIQFYGSGAGPWQQGTGKCDKQTTGNIETLRKLECRPTFPGGTTGVANTNMLWCLITCTQRPLHVHYGTLTIHRLM